MSRQLSATMSNSKGNRRGRPTRFRPSLLLSTVVMLSIVPSARVSADELEGSAASASLPSCAPQTDGGACRSGTSCASLGWCETACYKPPPLRHQLPPGVPKPPLTRHAGVDGEPQVGADGEPECGNGLCEAGEVCGECLLDCGPCHDRALESVRRCVDERTIALTFDDGPTEFTNGLLDTLAERGVLASFFVVGVMIDGPDQSEETKAARRAVLNRAIAEGHHVAHHSWTHRPFTQLTPEELRGEINRLDVILRELTCVRPKLVRAPFGTVNDEVLDLLYSMGLLVVNWNLDTVDWRYGVEGADPMEIVRITRETLASESPAGVIHLQHDTHALGLEVVDDILDEIDDAGYSVVTLEECLYGVNFDSCPPGLDFIATDLEVDGNTVTRKSCAFNGTWPTDDAGSGSGDGQIEEPFCVLDTCWEDLNSTFSAVLVTGVLTCVILCCSACVCATLRYKRDQTRAAFEASRMRAREKAEAERAARLRRDEEEGIVSTGPPRAAFVEGAQEDGTIAVYSTGKEPLIQNRARTVSRGSQGSRASRASRASRSSRASRTPRASRASHASRAPGSRERRSRSSKASAPRSARNSHASGASLPPGVPPHMFPPGMPVPVAPGNHAGVPPHPGAMPPPGFMVHGEDGTAVPMPMVPPPGFVGGPGGAAPFDPGALPPRSTGRRSAGYETDSDSDASDELRPPGSVY